MVSVGRIVGMLPVGAYLPQNSPPDRDVSQHFGRKTPDQLMPNQFSATANRFFGKRILSADVAECVCSATFVRSEAKYFKHGDTIDGSRWVAEVCLSPSTAFEPSAAFVDQGGQRTFAANASQPGRSNGSRHSDDLEIKRRVASPQVGMTQNKTHVCSEVDVSLARQKPSSCAYWLMNSRKAIPVRPARSTSVG